MGNPKDRFSPDKAHMGQGRRADKGDALSTLFPVENGGE